MRRACVNCGASDWINGRWCEDCLRMVLKTLASEAAAAIIAGLWYWLAHRL